MDRWPSLLLCLAFLTAAGCNSNPATYPVVGKVEFETGGPVVVGNVEFKSEELGINARGKIQRDGTFQLSTFAEHDGAVAGLHKCVVIQMVIAENIPGHRPSKFGVVDPKYGSYNSSNLTATINETGENNIVLKVRGIVEQPEEGTPHKH